MRLIVIPANAGIQLRTSCEAHIIKRVLRTAYLSWIPAFAGMTVGQETG
jgi:hypothetical protein